MMIQPFSLKNDENHTTDLVSMKKKNRIKTILTIIFGIIILNLTWWITTLCFCHNIH